MNDNKILGNIKYYNDQQYNNACKELSEKVQAIKAKYSQKGDYIIAESAQVKKISHIFNYRIEKVKVPYYKYSKEVYYENVTRTSTRQEVIVNEGETRLEKIHYDDIDTSDVNYNEVYYDSHDDNTYYYQGNKYVISDEQVYVERKTEPTQTVVNKTDTYTVPERRTRLKREQCYLDEKIIIKNIKPGMQYRVRTLEEEFAENYTMYKYCKKPDIIDDYSKLKLYLIGLLEFIVSILSLVALVVFPNINSFGLIVKTKYDFLIKYILPYCGFLNNIFNVVTFIILLSVLLICYIILFRLNINEKYKLDSSFDDIIGLIYGGVFIVLVLSAIYYVVYHYLSLNDISHWSVDLIGALVVLIKNLSLVVIGLLVVYSLFVTVFNIYNIRMSSSIRNKKLMNDRKKDFLENKYPHLTKVLEEIKSYSI